MPEMFCSYIVENAPDIILTVDLKGDITSCNPAFEKETGYSASEIVGKSFLETPFAKGMGAEFAQMMV